MKKLVENVKVNPYLIASIFLAAMLRLLWLDRIPIGITGDELTYLFTAKLAYFTGKDITGVWNPLSVFIFRYPPHQFIQAELPYFFTPYLWLSLPFSLFISRLPVALMSIGTVLLMYGIGKKLFDKQTALVVVFLAAVNPWFIFTGRTFYEMPIATFFFLAALYILLIARRTYILFAIPLFFLAFYSYIATKLVFLPFVLAAVVFAYIRNKKFFIMYSIVFLACVTLVAFFLWSLHFHPNNSRLGEILLPNASIIANAVDQARKTTIQNPLMILYENKIAIYAWILISRFVKTFSFDFLFLTGDSLFTLWQHGLFYVIDAVFFCVGLLFLIKKDVSNGILLLVFMLLGSLPQLLHTNSASAIDTGITSYHITMLFPFMLFVIAYGISYTIYAFKKITLQKPAVITIIILYSFSLLNLCNVYFFVLPLQNYYDAPVHVLSRYTTFVPKNINISLYTPNPHDTFEKYLFYTNKLTPETIPEIQSAFSSPGGISHFNNITFHSCDKTAHPVQKEDIVINSAICGLLVDTQAQPVIIAQLVDGGSVYEIYNDKVCNNILLQRYPSNITIKNLLLDNLSRNSFCQTYITSAY